MTPERWAAAVRRHEMLSFRKWGWTGVLREILDARAGPLSTSPTITTTTPMVEVMLTRAEVLNGGTTRASHPKKDYPCVSTVPRNSRFKVRRY